MFFGNMKLLIIRIHRQCCELTFTQVYLIPNYVNRYYIYENNI